MTTSYGAWAQMGSAIGAGLAGIWKGMRGSSEANDQATIQFNRTLYLLKKQQEYETYMSNTAHQREVADLKQAGLNPILSANAGASTPASGLGTAQMSNAGQIEAESGKTAIEGAINATNAGSALMSAKSQKQLNKAIEEKTQTERSNIAMDTEKKSAETTQLNIENKYLPRQLKANILQTEGQTALNQAKQGEVMSATNLNYENAKLIQSDQVLKGAQIKEVDTRITEIKNRIKNDTSLTNEQVSKLKAEKEKLEKEKQLLGHGKGFSHNIHLGPLSGSFSYQRY